MAAVVVGDGVADLRVADILDIGDDESTAPPPVRRFPPVSA